MFEPIIKWSGSKRSQAESIVGFFPKKIETYYEPFCGGASVLRRLISSGNKVGCYVCSDLNGSLIALWNAIKDRPYDVAAHYEKLWNELYAIKDIEEKKKYFLSEGTNIIGSRTPEFTLVDCPTMDDKLGNKILKSSDSMKQEVEIHNFL